MKLLRNENITHQTLLKKITILSFPSYFILLSVVLNHSFLWRCKSSSHIQLYWNGHDKESSNGLILRSRILLMENVKEISKVEIKKVFWAPCGYLINFLNHLEPSEWTYLLYFFGFKLIGCFFFDILLKPYPCTRSQLPPTPTKVSARIHDFSWKIRLLPTMLELARN